jgi:mitogen-activated protein kinase kinase
VLETSKVSDAHPVRNLAHSRLEPPPIPGGVKRRPPPLDSGLEGIRFSSTGMLGSDTGTGSARPSAIQPTLSSTLAKLDMVKFDLREEDLRYMGELGQGNGGSVTKVEHVPSGTIMANKVDH